eukprot:gene22147-8717_t
MNAKPTGFVVSTERENSSSAFKSPPKLRSLGPGVPNAGLASGPTGHLSIATSGATPPTGFGLPSSPQSRPTAMNLPSGPGQSSERTQSRQSAATSGFGHVRDSLLDSRSPEMEESDSHLDSRERDIRDRVKDLKTREREILQAKERIGREQREME